MISHLPFISGGISGILLNNPYAAEERAFMKKLLAVDANSVINRAFYGIKLLTTKDGSFTNGIYGFLNIFFKLLEEVNPDMVAFAFDLKAPTFRHQMYDGYKAQRKGMPDELASQLVPLKELLSAMGYRILELQGYEADDILGTLAERCCKGGFQCVIATGDRDSLQLVDDCVTVRLTSTKMGRPESVVYDTAAIQDKYGVTPPQLIEVKALMGDPSDNIPGVAGIGEKTALDLIKEHGTLAAIYDKLQELEMRGGVKAKLEKDREMAFLSRKLAEIDRNVPLNVELTELIPDQMDAGTVYRQLSRLEMASVIKRLGLVPPTGGAPSEADTKDAAEEPFVGTTATPALAGVRVTLGDPTAFGRLAVGPVLDLFCGFDGAEIRSAAIGVGGEIACLDDTDPAFHSLLAAFLSSEVAKRTNHSKKIYAYGYNHGSNIRNIIFDVELSAYLLNPNASEYDLERLAIGEYGIAAPELAGLSDVAIDGISKTDNLSMERLAYHASLLGPLCDRLEAELMKTEQLSLFREIELPLCRVLASMEHVGFRLDTEGLAAFGRTLDGQLQEMTGRIYFSAGSEFNINSPQQLSNILFNELGLPTRKKIKSGFSTDAEVLESLKGKHPIIEDILEYRKLAKLKSTYVEGLLRLVDGDGRVRTSFRQTETRTGRISSIEPNLQNIPVRTKLGSELRKFFIADEGHTLIDADYSQIELRVLAHIAGDEHMIEAFRNDEDIHTLTASQVFHMPLSFVTPQMRSRAKAVNFGIVYGIGAFSLSQDIGVTVAEADSYIKGYLQSYSGVKKYMDETVASAKQAGYVKTLYGRRRPVPELSAQNHVTKMFGERVAMNTPIQGTAADIIKLAMIRVYNRLQAEGLASRLILQVHDELIVEGPIPEAARAGLILHEEMEAAAMLSAPLRADVNMGQSWYDAK